MQNLADSPVFSPPHSPAIEVSAALSGAAVAGAVARHACQCAGHDTLDRQFVAMLDGYRSSGGLGCARELQEALTRKNGSSKSSVALLNGWIARREVICFEWQGSTWFPWFQFDATNMSLRPQLDAVLQELNTVYDPWEVGCWFARPNPWLADRAPVDALMHCLPEVLHAARAERFIAR